MQCELPSDLRADIKAEVVRIVKLLEGAGWTVDAINWEPNWDKGSERRVNFSATHKAGKRFHSTCPQSSLSDSAIGVAGLASTASQLSSPSAPAAIPSRVGQSPLWGRQ
jgi:hypothetical protein